MDYDGLAFARCSDAGCDSFLVPDLDLDSATFPTCHAALIEISASLLGGTMRRDNSQGFDLVFPVAVHLIKSKFRPCAHLWLRF